MIVDKLENIANYSEIPADAVNFIRELTDDIKLGKYNIGLWSDVKNVYQVAENMIAIEDKYVDLKVQGETARKIVEENYTWPKICDRYLDMVKEF